jgi:16S rRNA (adenine1518-N6/adenine1519-N6)-dimethyltransferase
MTKEDAPRQTLSYLIERFREAGIRPRTKLGQSFLIDLNLLDVLVAAAELDRRDVVLEVGTGTGSLTALLARRAARVVTVEMDRQLFGLAAEQLDELENVTMLQMDALRGKNRLREEVVEEVDRHVDAEAGRRFKLVANLPYNAATPILTNLVALERPPQSMTVTIQRELADRIVARPGTKDYGALSVWIQSQCRVEILRTLPPEAFWPRPKVSSAFLRAVVDEGLRARIPDRAFFHAFVRSLFLHRRKLLRWELASATKGRLDKPGVDRLLGELGLAPDARAEQLDVETMLRLCEAVAPYAPSLGTCSRIT